MREVIPFPVNYSTPFLQRRDMLNESKAKGYTNKEQALKKVREGLEAISSRLGDAFINYDEILTRILSILLNIKGSSHYFFGFSGAYPTSLDAIVFGIIAQVLCDYNYGLHEMFREYHNLCEYHSRIIEGFFLKG